MNIRDKMAGVAYMTIGVEFVLSILFGWYAGHWLDGKLGSAPYLEVIGFLLGVVAAFRSLWRAAKRMQRETERDGFSDSQQDRVVYAPPDAKTGEAHPPPDDDHDR